MPREPPSVRSQPVVLSIRPQSVSMAAPRGRSPAAAGAADEEFDADWEPLAEARSPSSSRGTVDSKFDRARLFDEVHMKSKLEPVEARPPRARSSGSGPRCVHEP